MTRMKKLISAALAIAMILSMTVPAFASVESESVNVMQLKNTPGFSEDNPIQMEKISDDGNVATYAADFGVV